MKKLLEKVHPAAPAGVALLLLLILYVVPRPLEHAAARERTFQKDLEKALEQAAFATERIASHETLRTADLEQLKAGLGGSAITEKTLFESGLSLQEERRLLDKQLEIMTTTLLVNPSLQRIFLMRGPQVLQGFLINYIPLRAFGGALANLPKTVRIISKERFAHPERGKSEEVDGTLQWVPPQVGTSVRAKALGEFVMFTNSVLILHGPPVSDEDHERFPHVCVGLDRESARRIYRGSFIGTRITLSQVSIEPTPDPVPTPAL